MSQNNELDIAEIPYPTGEIHYRYRRILAVDGSGWKRHGLFLAFHRNGARASEGNYEVGLEDGLWRDFHPNGQLAAQGHYRLGKQEGRWRFWDEAGHPEREVAYRDGREVEVDDGGDCPAQGKTGPA